MEWKIILIYNGTPVLWIDPPVEQSCREQI